MRFRFGIVGFGVSIFDLPLSSAELFVDLDSPSYRYIGSSLGTSSGVTAGELAITSWIQVPRQHEDTFMSLAERPVRGQFHDSVLSTGLVLDSSSDVEFWVYPSSGRGIPVFTLSRRRVRCYGACLGGMQLVTTMTAVRDYTGWFGYQDPRRFTERALRDYRRRMARIRPMPVPH